MDIPRVLVTEADLLAYVDGRLESERHRAVEAHLARCPQDAERVATDLVILQGLKLLFGRPLRRREAQISFLA